MIFLVKRGCVSVLTQPLFVVKDGFINPEIQWQSF